MTDIAAVIGRAKDLVRREAESVSGVVEVVGNDAFTAALEMLLTLNGKVITAGSGTSGTVARRMAHLLSVCGTPSLYLNPTDGLHGSLGAVADQDVVFALSKGGGTGELTSFASRAKARGARIVVLTCRPASELAEIADLVVMIPPGDSDPGNAMAMGSTFAMGAWGDALATSLMELRGYTWEQFLFTHPGGRVGEEAEALLSQIKDKN